MSTRGITVVIVLCLAMSRATHAATPSYSDGQRIEVREGDSWSSATILKHEGRKYQVHYQGGDASTDEWVTTDRMRPASEGGGSAPASQTRPSTRPATRPVVFWSNGQRIEVKWGLLWRKAVVMNKRGDWYLISYDNRGNSREWVEPWRIRKEGSTDDLIGSAPPNPGVRKGEDPPRPKPGPPPERDRPFGSNEPDPADAELPPLTEPDRSGSRQIVLGGDIDATPIAPDPAPKLAKPLTKQAIALKRGESNNERLSHVIPAACGAPIVATIRTNWEQHRSGRLSVQRFDLTSGQPIGFCNVGGKELPLALSADGKLLVTHPTGRNGRSEVQNRLNIWQLDAGEAAKPLISFVPREPQQQQPGFGDVGRVSFIDADHLLVGSPWGELSLWEFRKARCLWTCKGDAVFCVSGSGKYLATRSNAKIAVVEVMTGKLLSEFETDGGQTLSLSFSPDGTQLAAAGQDSLLVWDLTSAMPPAVLSPVGAGGWTIDWQAPGWILLDHQKLVSVEKQVTVWTYAMPGDLANMAATIGGRFWYAVDSGPEAVLCGVTLPHDAARAAAKTVDTDAEMVIRPGLRVTLDVNVPGDARDKVTAELKAKLKANGIGVYDGQPLKMIAKVEPGASHEMQYRSIGPGLNVPLTKLTVQDLKATLAYLGADGKILWQRVAVASPPAFLSMKQGQSVSDAVAQAMKPPLGLFESARIPGFVPKDPTGFGTSRLTAEGIVTPR